MTGQGVRHTDTTTLSSCSVVGFKGNQLYRKRWTITGGLEVLWSWCSSHLQLHTMFRSWSCSENLKCQDRIHGRYDIGRGQKRGRRTEDRAHRRQCWSARKNDRRGEERVEGRKRKEKREQRRRWRTMTRQPARRDESLRKECGRPYGEYVIERSMPREETEDIQSV